MQKDKGRKCPKCKGTSKIECPICKGTSSESNPCRRCNRYRSIECSFCSGTIKIGNEILIEVEGSNHNEVINVLTEIIEQYKFDIKTNRTNNKSYYNELIAKNEINHAIIELLEYFKENRKNTGLKQMILLSSNWIEYEMNSRLDLLSFAEKSIMKNKIIHSILSIIDDEFK